MYTPEDPQIIRVSDARICEVFNSSQHATAIEQYLEAYRSDEVILDTTADEKGFSHGTRSQILRYYKVENRWRLVLQVEMHRYWLPEGRIGASGRPSPKRVLIGSIMYRYDKRLDPPK